MSGTLQHIAATVATQGLRLRKALPRNGDHLLLDLVDADGSTVAGQWFAEPARAVAVARETRARTDSPDDVAVLGSTGILLQPGGADRRLPLLHRLVAAPSAALVAHRPERRGVVRQASPDGSLAYAKVVLPDRLAAVARAARLSVPGVTLPRMAAVDAGGVIVTHALPGRTLLDLVADPAVPEASIATIGNAVGEAMARLHAVSAPAGDVHDAAAELAVTCRWLEAAHAYALLPDPSGSVTRPAVGRLAHLLAEPACAPSLLHRDLHDKQILVTASLDVGMLDFDLAAVGEPALDLANLLVHLELRAKQERCTDDRASVCARAVIDGYNPTACVRRRIEAYALATRLRLACVYAFRPAHHHAVLALLTTATRRHVPAAVGDPHD